MASVQGKQMRPDYAIDITYSLDSQMIHRYINFEISSQNHEKVFVALQQYVQSVEQDDQGAFMYHQIQEQVQQSQNDTKGRSTDFGMKRARRQHDQEKQITVAMVMDPDSLSQQALLRKQMAVSLKNSSLFSEDIGAEQRFKTMHRREIDESPLEQLLSKWAATFLKCMNYNMEDCLVENTPRFSEIRPA